MVKKVCTAIAALAVALTLTACGSVPQGSSQGVESSQAEESVSQTESSQPTSQPESSAVEEPSSQSQVEKSVQETAVVLVQQDSGAEAGYEPTFTLNSDGTFSLFVAFYDGTATITGTYTAQDNGYVLTPEESTAQGVMGSEAGEMTLTQEGAGYTYSGSQLGLIYDGAVFLPSQG